MNASANGSLLKKSVNEANEIMDIITYNNQNWGTAEAVTIKTIARVQLVRVS